MRDEEVTGELPEDLEYEEFNRSANSWRRSSKNNLLCTKPESAVGSWSGGTRISVTVSACSHFDVARIVIDQAVRLGVAQQISPDCQRNGSRLMITEPR